MQANSPKAEGRAGRPQLGVRLVRATHQVILIALAFSVHWDSVQMAHRVEGLRATEVVQRWQVRFQERQATVDLRARRNRTSNSVQGERCPEQEVVAVCGSLVRPRFGQSPLGLQVCVISGNSTVVPARVVAGNPGAAVEAAVVEALVWTARAVVAVVLAADTVDVACGAESAARVASAEVAATQDADSGGIGGSGDFAAQGSRILRETGGRTEASTPRTCVVEAPVAADQAADRILVRPTSVPLTQDV